MSTQEEQGLKIERFADPLVSHNINLIDTPGHADFTFEVLRSLRILDGAICILDGVAGVEAQTEKVWHQADKYSIPKIIYVNKLDRDGASFEMTVRDVAVRLQTWPAVCHIPWWEGGNGRFTGVGDAISLQAYRWGESGDGKVFTVLGIKDLTEVSAFAEEIKRARIALVELLSEHDDGMVEKFIECDEDHLAIPTQYIWASLRKCIINRSPKIVPIFAGASFRNIGVQPLLDAVVQLLPAPTETPIPAVSLGQITGNLKDLLENRLITDNAQSKSKSRKSISQSKKPSTSLVQNLEACALAFKVVQDPRRGALVYVRVYSGQIKSNSLLFNTNLQVSERAQRVLKMYASESVDIPEISAGQIGVIPGLKYTRTGDTLISYTGLNAKTRPPAPLDLLQLRPIEVPPAVFFAGVEPNSISDGKNLAGALALLIREDPSLQLSVDEDSGQTLLSGMGEFHLEIAGNRLINDFKAKASMGKIEIAYRENILQPSQPEFYLFENEIAGKRGKAGCIASVGPLSDNISTIDESLENEDFSTIQDGNRITISIRISDTSSMPPNLNIEDFLPPHLPFNTIYSSLTNGALAALSRGIMHSFPVRNAHVCLFLDPTTHLFPESTPVALSFAARKATEAAIRATAEQAGSALLELVMNVTISVDNASLGAVSSDLSSTRGGQILSLDDGPAEGEDVSKIDLSKVYTPPDPFASSCSSVSSEKMSTRQRNITARVPLKEMIGYMKYLRSLTAGRGTFVMSPDRFERVGGQRERMLLKELRGY